MKSIAEIKTRLELLGNFTEDLNEGLGFVDINETFIWTNKAACSIFGSKNLVNSNLKEFVNEKAYKTIVQQTALRKTGKSSSYELTIRSKDHNDSKKYLRVSAKPYFDDSNNFIGTFAVFHNVTNFKKVTKELVQQKKRKELLLDILAHDLKTHFMAISGYIQVLELDIKKEMQDVTKSHDERMNGVESILSGIKQSLFTATNLLNNLNIFLKEKTDSPKRKLEKMNVLSTLKYVEKHLVNSFNQRKINFHYSNVSQCQNVLADSLLTNIFLNVLGNSIRHTNEKHVIINIFGEQDKKSNMFILNIIDNGPGLGQKQDEIDLNTYSNKFVGLGLYIVNQLMKSYGGKVEIKTVYMEDSSVKGTLTKLIFNMED